MVITTKYATFASAKPNKRYNLTYEAKSNVLAKINKIIDMRKKKPIKLRRGCKKKLAAISGVSPDCIRKALQWQSDTDTQNKVRQMAYELGFVKRF